VACVESGMHHWLRNGCEVWSPLWPQWHDCAGLIWQAKLQFVPSISLQYGHTALDDARNEGHAAIVEVLKQYSR